MNYFNCSAQELEQEYQALKNQYEDVKGKGLNLNMARGKPGKAQLDLSLDMLDVINSKSEFVGADKMDSIRAALPEPLSSSRRTLRSAASCSAIFSALTIKMLWSAEAQALT